MLISSPCSAGRKKGEKRKESPRSIDEFMARRIPGLQSVRLWAEGKGRKRGENRRARKRGEKTASNPLRSLGIPIKKGGKKKREGGERKDLGRASQADATFLTHACPLPDPRLMEEKKRKRKGREKGGAAPPLAYFFSSCFFLLRAPGWQPEEGGKEEGREGGKTNRARPQLRRHTLALGRRKRRKVRV